MASCERHPISREALLALRDYFFTRNYGEKVMFRIFDCSYLQGNTKSIREILEDAGVPLTGRRSPFNKDELVKISTKAAEDFDITLLYKVLSALWEKNVNDPGEPLKKLIKGIKDERNSVIHEKFSFSESKLINKLSDFNKILQDALQEAQTLYSAHADKIKDLGLEIRDALYKITEKIREPYDVQSPEDREKLEQELELYQDALRQYIQEQSQKELKPIYKKLCRIQPFEWMVQHCLVNPCNIAVSLKMNTDKNFHAGLSSTDVDILDQKDLLKAKSPSGVDPDIIILSGDAGSGKSTILSSITEDWCKDTQDMSNLSSFKTLLYMQFRSHDHKSFDAYLQDYLKCTINTFTIERVKASILQSECLILCDGYDEVNDKSRQLFNEILNLKTAAVKIVVTTRPMNTKELTQMAQDAKHETINLSILGFRKEDMKKCTKKLVGYLRKDETEEKEMVLKLEDVIDKLSPEMLQILSNPLWFNMFVLLHVECPDEVEEINCVTKLYSHMKEHSKDRLKKKLGLTDDKIASFDKEYREWTLRYLIKRKYELSQDDVNVFESKCNQLKLEFNHIISSYFTIKKSLSGFKLVNIYCFRHRTEQEFDAASSICDKIIELNRDRKDEFDQMKREGCIFERALLLAVDEETRKFCVDELNKEFSWSDLEMEIEDEMESDMELPTTSVLRRLSLDPRKRSDKIVAEIKEIGIFDEIINKETSLLDLQEKIHSIVCEKRGITDLVHFRSLSALGKKIWIIIHKEIMKIMKGTSILSDIRHFVFGILYTKDRSLFHSVYESILPMNSESVDIFIKYLHETNNDDDVRHKITERLRETCNEPGHVLEVEESLSFSYLPQILKEIKPHEIRLDLDDDLIDVERLIQTLETTNEHRIRTRIVNAWNISSEALLHRANYCVEYRGNITEDAIKAIPPLLEKAWLKINVNSLKIFGLRIRTLEFLKELGNTQLSFIPLVIIHLFIS